MAPLLETNATLFCCIGTRQPANPFSVFDIDVCEKGGDYFPVSICPSKVYMLAARTEGKDQAFINVQDNIATSRKGEPSRGFEMIQDKMNIKCDVWQDEMNTSCCKPSASSARRTASAKSQVHHPSKKNVESNQQVHHPSKENSECYQQECHPRADDKCYQQRAPPSASQESSVPKHNRAPRKSGTSSATALIVPSKSECETGMEGHHHQDVPISLRLPQLFESSPVGNVTPEEVAPSSMSRAGISSRDVIRQLRVQDSDHDSAYLSGADHRATSMPLPIEKKEVLLTSPSSQNKDVDEEPFFRQINEYEADEESDKEYDRSQLSKLDNKAGDQGSAFFDCKVEDATVETKIGLFSPGMPCPTTIHQPDITFRIERADLQGNDRTVFKNNSTHYIQAGRCSSDRRSMLTCDDLLAKTLLPLIVQPRVRQSAASSSDSVDDEGTECFQRATSSEESEESESPTDSNDEVRSRLSRTGTVCKDNRQGNGVSVKTAAGVFSPRKPRMTSIKTPVPPEYSTGGHTHALFIIDDRTVTEWLQGVIKDVTESPTKRRRYDPRQPFKGSELPSFVPQLGLQNQPYLNQDDLADYKRSWTGTSTIIQVSGGRGY